MLNEEFVFISIINQFSIEFLLDQRYELVKNSRGGVNLLYNGFVFRKKAEYMKTINWVCLNNQCRARVRTSLLDKSIRESKREHCHPMKRPLNKSNKKWLKNVIFNIETQFLTQF